MNKETILLVHNFYQQFGGEDTVFKQEKQMLEENGHKVIVYTRDNKEINNIFKKIFLPIRMISSKKTKKDIKKIVKENHIDIIHVHNILNLISPSIYEVANELNIPIVQTIHNFRLLCPNGLFYRDNMICEDCPNKGLKCAIKHKCYRNSKLQTRINVMMLKRARRKKLYKNVNFIFLTEFNKNKFFEYNKKLDIFDESKFFIKPNFIDENVKVPNVKKNENQYIYVGRLEESKGIKDLINVWHKVNDKKLIVCGTGTLEDELKKYVNINHLNVEFKGFVNKEEVIENIASSKALIFPSRLYEGFPMSILESIYCNTPVIANNIGNAGSIVNDKIGYKYNNSDELINIINNFNSTLNISIKDTYKKELNYQELIKIYNKVNNN